MSLGSALQIAQNSLLNVTKQTSVVSRNVTDASNENYTRRQGVVESSNSGSRVVVVRSGANAQLHQAGLQALADSEAQSLIANQLEQLNITINGADGSRSPSALLSKLHGALQIYSANPTNSSLASAAVQDAKDLANGLNSSAKAVNSFQASMDSQISQEVDKLNQLLADFHQANSDVVDGNLSGRDNNDAMDLRDAKLKEISKIVPVNTLNREGNDLVLVTQGGATLYETIPRTVTFEPQVAFGGGIAGNAIRIDGVPVLGGQGANTSSSGSLSAMAQIRDDTASKIGGQLDEVARGILSAFSESDTSGGGAPNLAGLFSFAGGPSLPPSGVHVPGLATVIEVNSAFDPHQGGNPNLLRDGGANGASYLQNQSGGEAYSNHLISLVQSLDVTSSFDEQTGVGGTMSLLSYATQSSGWLDGLRSEASDAATSKQALVFRLSEKLSDQTGVNIDEEMAQLLQLERSYEASARLISAVDEMLNTLLSIAR